MQRAINRGTLIIKRQGASTCINQRNYEAIRSEQKVMAIKRTSLLTNVLFNKSHC